MIKKFKNMILALAFVLPMGTATLIPVAVYAVDNTTGTTGPTSTVISSVCGSANATIDGSGTDSTTGCDSTDANGGLKKIANKFVTIFSIVIGIAAVVMIVYGGFKYITSGGESSKVGSAKNTLIYAIVGLLVVAMAQFVVRYVLSTASTAVTSGGL